MGRMCGWREVERGLRWWRLRGQLWVLLDTESVENDMNEWIWKKTYCRRTKL